MERDYQAIENSQRAICEHYGQPFVVCHLESKLGLARHTIGTEPVNGLRHKPEGDTNGWYIWCGEYSSDADFFAPLHTLHVYAELPQVGKFLGLPPGYRFLLDRKRGYMDVWFDPALLNF